jgi:putative FmdB family regulatory protein
MPTYVYACDACGTQFEKVQSFSEDPLSTCVCGQEGAVRRVFQPVGIVFKGSGWYINDSRKSESSSETKTDTKSEKSESSSEDKSDTKSEDKSDTKSKDKSDTKSESSSSDTSGAKSTSAGETTAAAA